MIEIINTGGTFNKEYNKINGKLEVRKDCKFIKDILSSSLADSNLDIKITQIISKDSLDMNNNDRKLLFDTILSSEAQNIIVVHGTDTMFDSIEVVKDIYKKIIFTGAMVPFSISPIEATANFMMAIGAIEYIQNGVYVAMNGLLKPYKEIKKDYQNGLFVNKDL